MRSKTASPVLADAADVLSDQLRMHLRRLARLLKPHAGALERRVVSRLLKLRFEPRQRTALAALTPGAAARIVSRGRQLGVFLEQVEYNGRRLAKLNLPPSDIAEALAESRQHDERGAGYKLTAYIRGPYIRKLLIFMVIWYSGGVE